MSEEKKNFGKKNFNKPTGNRKGPYGKPAMTNRKGPYGKPATGRPATGRPATARPAKPAEMEGLAARRLALKVLREVTEQGAYASLSLDKALQGSGISGVDRRLVSRLVYDTLDHLGYLDHMLSQVMAREDTDIKLRNILRLGACQILLMDRIPESAATNTCVQLCVENGMEGLKGVCNGILRNLVRKKDELTLPDPETEPEKYFAINYSLPEWLGTRLRQDWGEEAAKEIASWRNTDSAISIRRNLLKTDEAGFQQILEKKIWGKEKSDLPGAWRISGAMDIARDADFLAGNFSIQSESSMMVCLAVGARRGMQVLDCCAAPGGKTCYLSEIMGDTGRVQAWDIHDHRVQLIAAQQKRLGLENIRPIQRDATKHREDLDARMDAVLLDAPCSGLGVLAEKPDIKLRVSEESVEELIALQRQLLETVSQYVKPGGVLVYSTCSLLKAENENQVRAFLEAHPEFTAEPLPETIPEKYRQHQALGLQLLPHRDGVEGFYLCRMRRKESI
ncbi:MAG: 16S rRNA (cytosine(967)-C(5))-methyltransferase RsmB [Clostridia bacterium]|nr:16S rRNA (cytosine(967)-C(5))-methyltransferase RsmB [Clostridia bacterium]